MKTLDRARTKARKAFAWGNSSSLKAKGGDNGSYGKGKSPRPPLEDVHRNDSEGRDPAGEYQPIGAKSPGLKQDTSKEFVWSTGPTPFSEVRLADLVVMASSTGHRKKKGVHAGKGGLDGEFEIIPHVRSVIVLEDGIGNGELDEGWECVQADEDERRRGRRMRGWRAAAMESQ
ncbi:hypothetical protein NMY22_g19874 [Coprinellus aureogranulatus]|nr:hypothetical protein NMY22_g19874 [Coprinellus aureogranulatus]